MKYPSAKRIPITIGLNIRQLADGYHHFERKVRLEYFNENQLDIKFKHMKKFIVLISTLTFTLSLYAQGNSEIPASLVLEPIQVVKEFLTAYREGNHEKVNSLFHPDVVWVQPGDNRISGLKKSRAELNQMGGKMVELSARTLKLTDVKIFSATGNTVVCILHWKAVQPTGNVLDIDNIDEYTVENGRIIMAKIFSEDIAKEDKFWGK